MSKDSLQDFYISAQEAELKRQEAKATRELHQALDAALEDEKEKAHLEQDAEADLLDDQDEDPD